MLHMFAALSVQDRVSEIIAQAVGTQPQIEEVTLLLIGKYYSNTKTTDLCTHKFKFLFLLPYFKFYLLKFSVIFRVTQIL